MRRSVSLLVLLGFIWGSGYSLARYATTHGVSPLSYAFWQSLGPAIVLLLFSLKSWLRDDARLLQYWPYYLISGLLGIALPNTNMYFSAPHLPAGTVAVIANTVPLMVYPLALIFGQERFVSLRLAAVLLGVVGIMLIVVPGAEMYHSGGMHWVLMTLLTPLSFALCVIYISRYRPPQLEDSILSTGMLIMSSILLLPVVLHSHGFYWFAWPLSHVSMVVLLEIVLSSMGYLLFFRLIKLAGPVYYSLVSGVVCLTGLFWGWLFFSEQLSVGMLIAVIFILVAIVLVTFTSRGQVE